MRNAKFLPSFKDEYDLSINFGSAGYGQHDISQYKKALSNHKKKLKYVTQLAVFFLVLFIIFKTTQKPEYVWTFVSGIIPPFIMAIEWGGRKEKKCHLSDLIRCFAHGVIFGLPIAIVFRSLYGNLQGVSDVDTWRFGLFDNLMSFILISSIYEEVMKAILCYFCYKSNQSSVHYRCLAFSLAFIWYELFEMHVAARDVGISLNWLMIDLMGSIWERMMTAHFAAAMFHQENYLKKVLLCTIPTRIACITARTCMMLVGSRCVGMYVMLMNFLFLYVSPFPSCVCPKYPYSLFMHHAVFDDLFIYFDFLFTEGAQCSI